MSFCIKLADKRIRIYNLYPYVEEYCKEYIVDEKQIRDVHYPDSVCDPAFSDQTADLTVSISMKDIEYERNKSAREDLAEKRPVRQFREDYLETLAVYRKIAEWMPLQDTVLFHGSGIALDGRGYLFTAKSGTGKSTHTRLWRECFGERAFMVNDDKPLITIKEQNVLLHGTPWNGKHRLDTNCTVLLKGICILHRSDKNRICPAQRADAYPMFLQQLYRPSDKESMRKTLILADELLCAVPVYDLYCNMEPDAAQVAYEGMQS